MKRRELFTIILSLVISISASSQTTDCNGVVNGPAMVDTCGTCHQAYIYDFITHSTTFINDTIGIVLGDKEGVNIDRPIDLEFAKFLSKKRI